MNFAVFCGAGFGKDKYFIEQAKKLGKYISQKGILIYGGSSAGLMGVVAKSVKENDGKIIGVMPKFLQELEIPYKECDEFIQVSTMDERKNLMIEKADYCIAFVGGIGTLEEIIQAFSMARLGKNNAKIIFLNINNYYQQILDMYDKMVKYGFLSMEDRNKVYFIEKIEDLENI